MANRRRFKQGFTLVELLVVIGIIGLLVAILLPALVRAKKQALTTICQSNLRQWGIGFTMYAQENHGFIAFEEMRDWTSYPTSGTWMMWCGHRSLNFSTGLGGVFNNDNSLLHRYLTHAQNISDDASLNDLAQYASYQGTVSPSGTSPAYGCSATFLVTSSMTAANSFTVAVRSTAVRDPSETFLLADSAQYLSVTGGALYSRNTAITPPYWNGAGSAPRPYFHGRHPNGGNVLWFDGHVTTVPVYKFPPTQQVMSFANGAQLNTMGLSYLMPSDAKQSDASRANFYFWINKINHTMQ